MITSTFKFNLNKEAPWIIKKAVMQWLVRASLSPERNAKIITTEENHVITWRFRASINLNAVDWIPRDKVKETKSDDWIHEELLNESKLTFWSNVEYAASLERKYSILARSLDMSRNEMSQLFTKWVKDYLYNQK
jgi:hypothetical protein